MISRTDSVQILAVLGLALALSVIEQQVHGAETRAQTPVAARHTNATRHAKRINNGPEQRCGEMEDLVARVDYCAEPLIDILSGKLKKWPRNEDDALAVCEQFGFSERCIKDAARKCAKGLQKTIVSTIGTSVQRVRKRECSRAKAGGVLKTMQCIESHQKVVQTWMSSVVARLTAIETQETAAEKKVNAICCMVNDIDREISANLEPFCPTEAALIQRLFRGVVDSAVDIICRSPKCTNYLKKFDIKNTGEIDGLISIILRIIFSLDNSDE